jgi:mono/diheme cytochrome c family protein
MIRRASLLIAVAALGAAACSRASSSVAGSGAAAMPAPSARPAAVTDALIAEGGALFNGGNCRNCHGQAGVGAQNGPSLADKTWLQISGGYDEIVGVITNGVTAEQIKDATHTRAMRGRGGPANLTDAQIRAIAAYVWSLSNM